MSSPKHNCPKHGQEECDNLNPSLVDGAHVCKIEGATLMWKEEPVVRVEQQK